jgi:hypothetical protein
VRRLLNVGGRFDAGGDGPLGGPPARWADTLTALAVEQGFSVFILGSDEPDDLRRFAAEVAPDVRERVSAERARHR